MPTELAVAQFIAYVMLTISGLTVAVVSLIFAYRNSFGWKPLAFVTSHGLAGTGGKDEYFLTLAFEVWNRRKYPLILRYVDVVFSELEIYESKDEKLDPEWFVNGKKKLIRHKEDLLDPATHRKFEIKVPFKKRVRLDDVSDNIVVNATYYDPRKNKMNKLVVQHRYQLT